MYFHYRIGRYFEEGSPRYKVVLVHYDNGMNPLGYNEGDFLDDPDSAGIHTQWLLMAEAFLEPPIDLDNFPGEGLGKVVQMITDAIPTKPNMNLDDLRSIIPAENFGLNEEAVVPERTQEEIREAIDLYNKTGTVTIFPQDKIEARIKELEAMSPVETTKGLDHCAGQNSETPATEDDITILAMEMEGEFKAIFNQKGKVTLTGIRGGEKEVTIRQARRLVRSFFDELKKLTRETNVSQNPIPKIQGELFREEGEIGEERA
jgi:hypothetical protein